MAMTNEFQNRYLKADIQKKQREHLVKIIGDTIITAAKISPDFGVIALKELFEYMKAYNESTTHQKYISMYLDPSRYIKEENPEIYKVIVRDIRSL